MPDNIFSFFCFCAVQEVDFHGHEFTHVPEHLASLPQLQVVKITKCRLGHDCLIPYVAALRGELRLLLLPSHDT